MHQLTLFDEPKVDRTYGVPYASGSDTSKAMALILSSNCKTKQDEWALYQQFELDFDGLTDYDIRVLFNWTSDYERPRRWTLSHKLKLICEDGTRRNPGGNLMTVWRLKKYKGLKDRPLIQ